MRLRDPESGQISAILPVLVVLGVGTATYFGYQKLTRGLGARIRSESDITLVAANIQNRVKGLLSGPGPTVPPGVGGGCGDLLTATTLNAKFRAFRDFSTGPGPALTLSLTRAELDRSCLLPDTDIPPLNPSVGTVSLNLRRDRVDANSLSASITMSLTLVSQPRLTGADREPVQTVQLNKALTLKVASLGRYAVVFTDTGAGPQVSTGGGGTVNFWGPVFVKSQSGTSIDYARLAGGLPPGNSSVIFNRRVDFRARSLNGLTDIDLFQLRKIYAGGVRTKVLDTDVMEEGALPISDGGVTKDAWGQRIFLSLPPNPNNAALVAQTYLWNAGATPPGSIPPAVTPGSFGEVLSARGQSETLAPVIPNPPPAIYPIADPNPKNWIEMLSSTCKATAGPVLIHTNLASSATFNFATASPNDTMVCGVIAADTITFNLNGPGTRYFLGSIVTRNIIVNGPGNLLIGSPLDSMPTSPFPNATVPGQTLVGLFDELQGVATSGAHNYFVPIFRSLPGVQSDQVRFRPHGPLSVKIGTQFVGVTHPLLLPGVVHPCGTPANAFKIGNLCSGPWWSVDTAFIDQLQNGNQAVTDLFPTGQDNLVFLVEDTS